MTTNNWLQLTLYFVVLAALVKPLGTYMARVYEAKPCGLDGALGWLERVLYRFARIDAHQVMTWRTYAVAALAFNAVGFFAVYGLLRLQDVLALNP